MILSINELKLKVETGGEDGDKIKNKIVEARGSANISVSHWNECTLYRDLCFCLCWQKIAEWYEPPLYTH